MSHFFAENLADLLRIKGVTQKQLADNLKLRPSTVNQWVNGKREPDFENLIRLCILLDTEPSEILGYEKAKRIIRFD